jgi:hypothetical protein
LFDAMLGTAVLRLAATSIYFHRRRGTQAIGSAAVAKDLPLGNLPFIFGKLCATLNMTLKKSFTRRCLLFQTRIECPGVRFGSGGTSFPITPAISRPG